MTAAEVGDAADVVAAQVDEHDVFGDFLFIGAEVGFEGAVGGFVGTAGAGAGDGAVLDGAAMDADEELGRGAYDVGLGHFGLLAAFERGVRFEAEAQEVHVWRGIDDAQGAVDVEGVDAGDAVEALREDTLEDVAGADVVLGLEYRFEEGGFGGAWGKFELAQNLLLRGAWAGLGQGVFRDG